MPSATTSPPARPMPGAGLPAWATVRLDEALAAGFLSADQLDGLSVPQLASLARALVRAGYGKRFDASSILGELT